MKSKEINIPNEKALILYAQKIANALISPALLTFSGDLGAGKTTFIRAMLSQLGISSPIKSPTFSLVETYETPDFLFHHFDLYRMEEEEELEHLGSRDYFEGPYIMSIEWPERAPKTLCNVDMRFFLIIKGEQRLLQILALTQTGEKILSGFEGLL